MRQTQDLLTAVCFWHFCFKTTLWGQRFFKRAKMLLPKKIQLKNPQCPGLGGFFYNLPWWTCFFSRRMHGWRRNNTQQMSYFRLMAGSMATLAASWINRCFFYPHCLGVWCSFDCVSCYLLGGLPYQIPDSFYFGIYCAVAGTIFAYVLQF